MDFRGEITVTPVQDDAALQEFLRLPWSIYRNDPHWVPPILSHQRQFLDKKHGPFFEIGEAQYFLAQVHGRSAGRISAHVNRLHDESHGPDTGFFGFFESTPDQEVASALFEAAAAWLRERGKTRLVGPLNFCIYDEMGLLVEGFDSMPALLQTHNPPYYEGLLTTWGFRKAFDWHAYKLTHFRKSALPDMERQLAEILRGQNLVLRTLLPGELTRRADEIYELFNEAWSRNWGHVPLTRRQFQDFLDQIKLLLRPQLVNLVLDHDRLVGFGICLPDINPLIQKLNGRLSLWGKLRLLYEAKYRPIHKLRALVIGVSQPYQRRKLHNAIILFCHMYLIRHHPCEIVDFSLIPENLRHWIKVLLAYGIQRYKVFRVFEREI